MAKHEKKIRPVKKGTKIRKKGAKPFGSLAERFKRIRRRTSKITGRKKK